MLSPYARWQLFGLRHITMSVRQLVRTGKWIGDRNKEKIKRTKNKEIKKITERKKEILKRKMEE